MKRNLALLLILMLAIYANAQPPEVWDVFYYNNPNPQKVYETLPDAGKFLTPSGEFVSPEKISFQNGTANLDASCGKFSSAVLSRKLHSPQTRPCWFGVGGAAFSVFINGRKVYDFRSYGLGNDFFPVSSEDHIFPAELQKGENQIVIFTDRTNWRLDYVYGAERKNPWTLCFKEKPGYQPAAAKLAHTELLLRPDQGSVMFCFITETPVPAGVEYRKTGETQWMREYDSVGDLILREKSRIHRILLTGLEADAEYEYRLVLLEPPAGREGFRRPLWTNRFYKEISTPVKRFRTFGNKKFRFAVLGDTQLSLSRSRNTTPQRTQFMKKFQDMPFFREADFIVHVGDLDSYMHDVEDACFTRFFDLFGEKKTGVRMKPWVCVRGNHEADGLGAENWFDYFTMPEQPGYYAFRNGDVFFLVLDCGDFNKTKLNGYNGPILISEVLQKKQAAWLNRIKKTPEFKNAKFRVILAHTTPQCADDQVSKQINSLSASLLRDRSPEGRIHLWIGGHIHIYLRMLRDSDKMYSSSGRSQGFSSSAPVTWVAVDAPKGESQKPDFSYLDVQTDENLITVKSYDENGILKDHFTIDPDGNGKEIFRSGELYEYGPNSKK